MRTKRPTVDFEELRRIANQVRIDTLNAIDELVIRTMSEGKDVETLSRRVKKALKAEMDEAAFVMVSFLFNRQVMQCSHHTVQQSYSPATIASP